VSTEDCRSPDLGMIGARGASLLVVLLVMALLPDAVRAQTSWPELALVQDLRIDGHAADLVPIHRLWVSRDGVIAVAQPQDNAVRFFDPAGRSVGSVGRAGDGPGEFRALSYGGWVGDTLWVYDGRLSRMTFIGPERQVLRSTLQTTSVRPREADAGRIPEFRVAGPQAVHPDGSVDAVLLQPTGPAAAGWDQRYTAAFRVSAAGRILWLIGRVPDSGHEDFYYYPTLPDGSVRGRPLPFAVPPGLEWSPDGSRVALTAAGARRGAEVMIDVIMMDRGGDTLYARSYPVRAIPLPRSVADSAIAANVAALGPAGDVWASHARSRVPQIYPPVETGSVVGRDGSLWLALRGTTQIRQYLVLDPAGNVRGMASLPRNVQIRAADENHVWGIELDQYQVPSIVRYRFAAL
jgi:hypothetical protein